MTASPFSYRRTDYLPRSWQFRIGHVFVVEWGRTYTHGKRFFLVQLRLGRRSW